MTTSLRHRPAALLIVAGICALGTATPAHAQVTPPPAPSNPLPSWASPPERLISPPASAALSADGLRAAWVAEDHRSVLTAARASASAEWAAPDRVLATRGTVGKIVFSPDGRRIAYENRRTWRDDGSAGDAWQFICVYDFASRRVGYVDPAFDADSDPAWSKDGSQISFTRKVDDLLAEELTRPAPSFATSAWQPPPRRPAEKFTMASIIAAPYIEPPAPSGDGRSIAYITREAENRNVYFLRIGGAPRRIVNYPDDDGKDLADVAVSQTGAAVAYTRGGRVNRHGDSPNPRSTPELPQQQVWIIGADGDAPRLVGPGHEPLFTPDNRYLLWRSGGNIKSVTLSWEHSRLLGVGEPAEFLMGVHEGLRFSPDGTKLAYERGSGIEIHDFATGRSAVIPHGGDTDVGPVWSPDSRHLVYRREPSDSPGLEKNWCGGGERYCGPMRSAQPWAIWEADVADLRTRKVWQAADGAGSVYYALDQKYSPGMQGDELFWSANDRIGFVWEHDGWRHLYSVPITGGEATLLTPGDGEVETAALSADRRQLIYATNIGDLGRRHLSSVGFDGTPARSLTTGEKSQWAPVPLAAGKLAYVGAGWADPPKVSVRDPSGSTSTATLPQPLASFPAAMLVRPELVEFPGSDGQKAFGQLFVPEHPNGCAVIFSHGGIRRQMLPGFHYMDAYHYLYEMNQYLASRGCVVLSVEYRSSIMRGEAFRNAPGWGFSANSEILDFVGAATYLMARKDVDASRGVGIYGLSWGGYMTAEALALHSDLFKVGFDMAGVHSAPDPVGYAHSAVAHLDSWTSPVFVIQGDDDMNVDFNEGTVFARAMQTRRPGVELKQEAVPGQTHDLYQTFQKLVEVYSAGSEFLLSHLGVK